MKRKSLSKTLWFTKSTIFFFFFSKKETFETISLILVYPGGGVFSHSGQGMLLLNFLILFLPCFN